MLLSSQSTETAKGNCLDEGKKNVLSDKWFLLVGISFGLLCMVQASLNICLRLCKDDLAGEQTVLSAEGADLTIISSVQEQEFARATLKEIRWIGLSDLEQEGVWKWVDGSQLDTSVLFWIQGEPNDKLFLLVGISFGLLCMVQASLNICLRLYLSSDNDIDRCDNLMSERDELQKNLSTYKQMLSSVKEGELKEANSLLQTCEDNLSQKSSDFSVLENKKQQVTEERDTLRLKLQEIGEHTSEVWVYFQSSLYLASPSAMTWNESRQYCQQKGADLSIITSVQEQMFAHVTFKESIWIGLTDLEQEGVWKWVDGSQLDTRESFWNQNEPNENHTSEGWVYFKSSLYLGSSTEQSWNESRQYCQREEQISASSPVSRSSESFWYKENQTVWEMKTVVN
ncbi:hypothetical protein WMY93_008151 [Mugilogobius chulae]|uniref:C-type lectin domain-containing protein n=1 Tax=Mugilogobius chulae TaxID=88201 RepID=A0AAW0PF64_9GOBI